MLFAVLVSSIVILFHVYTFRHGIVYNQTFTFWLPFLIMGFLIFYATFSFDNKFPLFLIFIFTLTLHLIPIVRQPGNMAWNTDAPFNLQLMNHVIKTGRWDFGYGTGEAFGYSFYPSLNIFLSILSLISLIPSMQLVKYLMAFVNPLTLLTFYVLLDKLLDLDAKSKNIIILMLSLNPYFHTVYSYACAESYAIILFPLILLQTLKQGERNQSRTISDPLVAIILLLAITISHHFTSYMVGFTLLVSALILYSVFGEAFVNRRLCMWTLILPSAWLMFIASFFISKYFEYLSVILGKMKLIVKPVGFINIYYSTYYPSAFLAHLTLIRNVMLVLFTFLGLLYVFIHIYKIDRWSISSFTSKGLKHYISSGRREYTYFGLVLLMYSALAFFFLFGVDWETTIYADIRVRLVNFLFFPIAIFSALGIYNIVSGNLTKTIPYKKIVASYSIPKVLMKSIITLILLIVFVPSTIVQAFPRYIYDETYSPVLYHEWCVAPEEQYSCGCWVGQYVNSSKEHVFTGSRSAWHYIKGYGFQELWYQELSNVTFIRKPIDTGYVVFYVVNKYNLQLPDRFGNKLDNSTIEFLQSNFHQVYDNGAIISYSQPYEPPFW